MWCLFKDEDETNELLNSPAPAAGFLFFAATAAHMAKSRALLQLNTTGGKKNKTISITSAHNGWDKIPTDYGAFSEMVQDYVEP